MRSVIYETTYDAMEETIYETPDKITFESTETSFKAIQRTSAKRMRGETHTEPLAKRPRSRRVDMGLFRTGCGGYSVDECVPLRETIGRRHSALLIFTPDPTEDVAVQLLLSIPYLKPHLWIVSESGNNAHTVHYQTINDDLGHIAGACRVLDPIGGGRAALRSLVHIENARVQAMVPLDFVAPPLVQELVQDICTN